MNSAPALAKSIPPLAVNVVAPLPPKPAPAKFIVLDILFCKVKTCVLLLLWNVNVELPNVTLWLLAPPTLIDGVELSILRFVVCKSNVSEAIDKFPFEPLKKFDEFPK